MLKTNRLPSDTLPIACITDALGTQHQGRGVLLVPLEDDQHGIFVAAEEIPALIDDLQYFLESLQSHSASAA